MFSNNFSSFLLLFVCRFDMTHVVVVPPWPKSVVWYNKSGRVDASENVRLVEDGLGMYMIEVKQSSSSDNGEWKCVVTSLEGSVGISTSTIDMEIPKNYRKPRFLENLKAVLTEEGLVSFECKVVGFPTPQLKWYVISFGNRNIFSIISSPSSRNQQVQRRPRTETGRCVPIDRHKFVGHILLCGQELHGRNE